MGENFPENDQKKEALLASVEEHLKHDEKIKALTKQLNCVNQVFEYERRQIQKKVIITVEHSAQLLELLRNIDTLTR